MGAWSYVAPHLRESGRARPGDHAAVRPGVRRRPARPRARWMLMSRSRRVCCRRGARRACRNDVQARRRPRTMPAKACDSAGVVAHSRVRQRRAAWGRERTRMAVEIRVPHTGRVHLRGDCSPLDQATRARASRAGEAGGRTGDGEGQRRKLEAADKTGVLGVDRPPGGRRHSGPWRCAGRGARHDRRRGNRPNGRSRRAMGRGSSHRSRRSGGCPSSPAPAANGAAESAGATPTVHAAMQHTVAGHGDARWRSRIAAEHEQIDRGARWQGSGPGGRDHQAGCAALRRAAGPKRQQRRPPRP